MTIERFSARCLTHEPSLSFERSVRWHFDRHRLQLQVSDDGANPMEVSIGVLDRIGKAWADIHVFRAWITDTQYAEPTAAGLTSAAPGIGNTLQTILANAAWLIKTDENGQATIDVTPASTPLTRYLYVGFDRCEEYVLSWA